MPHRQFYGGWRKLSSAFGSPAELASPMRLGSMNAHLVSIIFALHYFWCDFYKKPHYFQCKVLYLQKNKLVWNSYTILSASNSP